MSRELRKIYALWKKERGKKYFSEPLSGNPEQVIKRFTTKTFKEDPQEQLIFLFFHKAGELPFIEKLLASADSLKQWRFFYVTPNWGLRRRTSTALSCLPKQEAFQ